jgi:hypothetical protein
MAEINSSASGLMVISNELRQVKSGIEIVHK